MCKPTVLWVGDAVASTGFAACTHSVCDHLHASGYNVHVLGLNYFGDPHPYPYTIYPCRQPFDYGHDSFGVGRLPYLIDRIKPDVVVLLNDPWNISGYLDNLVDCVHKPKIVGWLAVDGRNQKGQCLNALDHVIVWTEFAKDELRLGGYTGDISIVPLGVDTNLFRPIKKSDARKKVCPDTLSPDAFIVGVVGRNQPRKRLDLTLQYFSEWIHSDNNEINNAYLYLHVAPTGDRGVDIISLVAYYDLNGRVILASPHIGHGEDHQLMPYIYSAFDVYLTTTQGEGWGLPCLEAMACGIPCIVPDWSALGSRGWTEDAVIRVECTSTAMSAPINSLTHTIGGIPDKAGTVRALQEIYNSRELRSTFSNLGIALVNCYTWENTGIRFREELEKILV